MPVFLWMRHLTALKLAEVHRRHLGTQLRDADREVTLHRGGLPLADSVSLAAQLLGTLTTPSQAAVKAETRLLVQAALNGIDPIDREVLALKHFEQLSTSEIAEILGLSKAGACRWLKKVRAYVNDEKTTFSSELVESRFLLGRPRRSCKSPRETAAIQTGPTSGNAYFSTISPRA